MLVSLLFVTYGIFCLLLNEMTGIFYNATTALFSAEPYEGRRKFLLNFLFSVPIAILCLYQI